MIDITRLLCGKIRPGDVLRYGRDPPDCHLTSRVFEDKRPVVVWNANPPLQSGLPALLRGCDAPAIRRVNHGDARVLIADLQFRVPVLLFSGGEPLLRGDLFELGQYAVSSGYGR